MKSRLGFLFSALAATLLAACGGELLALLPFVAAIGGAWQVAGNNAEQLRINQSPLYASGLSALTGTYVTASKPACGATAGIPANVTVKFEGTAMSLYAGTNTTVAPCLTGQSVNDTTLTLSNGLTYRNNFIPNLRQDMWVDRSNAASSYRFTSFQPPSGAYAVVQGCVKGSNTSSAATTVIYRDSDIAAGPEVEAGVRDLFIVRAGVTEHWTDGKFIGVSLIEFKNGAATLQLERRVDDAATPCV